MGRYVLKRLLMMIPVFIGVSLIVYCICGSNTRPILMKVGGEDKETESFLREWLEDVVAIENAGEDASVLKYPPPLSDR